MEVVLASAGIHIGITGVLFLCALVMGLDIADFRPLVFLQIAKSRTVLFPCSIPPFLPDNVISQHVSQFYGLPIPQRFPLQFPRKIGYAVAPAIFIVQLVNDFLHGVTGAVICALISFRILDFIKYIPPFSQVKPFVT